MIDFISLFALDNFNDIEISSGGIQARRRLDIAPLAFEIVVISDVWAALDQSRLEEFLNGANRALFERIYKSCNGIRIGSSKFNVLGFLTGNQSLAIPLDIVSANESGGLLGGRGLIVGKSREHSFGQETCDFVHVLRATSTIDVFASEPPHTVSRKYNDVEMWLSCEFGRALESKTLW